MWGNIQFEMRVGPNLYVYTHIWTILDIAHIPFFLLGSWTPYGSYMGMHIWGIPEIAHKPLIIGSFYP